MMRIESDGIILKEGGKEPPAAKDGKEEACLFLEADGQERDWRQQYRGTLVRGLVAALLFLFLFFGGKFRLFPENAGDVPLKPLLADNGFSRILEDEAAVLFGQSN